MLNIESMKKKALFALAISIAAIAITGCATSKKANKKTDPVVNAPLSSPTVVIPKRDIRGENIQRLLSAADDALTANRLTTPVQDNAYDRYQAVLMMDAENQRAKAGIQAIFSKYASLTRSAIRQGDYSKARSRLAKARSVDSNHGDLKRLSNELASAQRARPSQPKTKAAVVVKKNDEIILNPSSLSKKEDDLIAQLQSLAIDVREKDESVLIFARNDAEGRWIYKQMAEAVIGYRLRGDMRIGKKPKIQILPPID